MTDRCPNCAQRLSYQSTIHAGIDILKIPSKCEGWCFEPDDADKSKVTRIGDITIMEW